MIGKPDVDDAINIILDLIRRKSPYMVDQGHDVYLPGVWTTYATESGMVVSGDRDALGRVGPPLAETFSAAGWELCRRGILRPGVRNLAL
jgi:hypothetical protein